MLLTTSSYQSRAFTNLRLLFRHHHRPQSTNQTQKAITEQLSPTCKRQEHQKQLTDRALLAWSYPDRPVECGSAGRAWEHEDIACPRLVEIYHERASGASWEILNTTKADRLVYCLGASCSMRALELLAANQGSRIPHRRHSCAPIDLASTDIADAERSHDTTPFTILSTEQVCVGVPSRAQAMLCHSQYSELLQQSPFPQRALVVNVPGY